MTLPILNSTRGVHRTNIEWADYAVGSPFRFHDHETGKAYPSACVKVSSGCANCYAEAIGQRFGNALPYTKASMDRLDTKIDEGVIRHILTFRPQPAKIQVMGKGGIARSLSVPGGMYKNGRARPLLFLGDMTDIFGDWVPDHLIDQVIAAVALRPDVDVIVLTKRAKRMAGYFTTAGVSGRISAAPWGMRLPHPYGVKFMDHPEPSEKLLAATKAAMDAMDPDGSRRAAYQEQQAAKRRASWPLPNLWLYVSVEDQATADERIPHLLACSAAVRGVSAEPLLGSIDLSRWVFDRDAEIRKLMNGPGAYNRDQADSVVAESLDHLIIGGESGRGARPMHPDWARSLRDQCVAAGVLYFFKQWGAHVAVYDRDHDDPDWRRCDSVSRATPAGAWLSLTGGSGFHGDRVVRVNRVSKHAAGRLLDGREWNQMPGGGA